ncbi:MULTISPECIES: protein kinase domain-containing protein [Kitasatospora]|uniref:Protein kinase domain-containing protein n=1 Tax=Kitasatospora cystarginea TaxID=58350 RepID=A0ABN3EUJ0_9ACTN
MEPLEANDPEAIGPYRLVARLGAGGMGRVYLARSAGGRTVAVKVVRSELAEDREFRTRFRREVEAARAVDGAYTAPVVDADPDSPTPWLATAYVLGLSLTDAVQRYGPLPEDSVRALGARLAEALHAIHGAGLVHRDLKPSNVLLAADGPRVIDFGIARALDGDRLTQTGVVVGSPGFMAPEQAMGRPLGAAGDVFSLGSVLVYATTGHGPFDGESGVAAQLYRVVHDEPDLSELPDGLRRVIAGVLTKDPARRPAPLELAAQLLPAGTAATRAGNWLPGPVASALATHASSVMDMETPSRGTPAQPLQPATPPAAEYAPTGTDLPGAAPGTMRLGPRTATPTPPLPGPTPTPPLPGPTPSAMSPSSATGPTATPMPSPAHAPTLAPPSGSAPKVSRRFFLAGGGVAAAAAVGGTAWALLSPHPAPHPKPPAPTPGSSGSATAGKAPTPVWTYTFPGASMAQFPALVLNGAVFVVANGLTALDAGTGTVRWARPDLSAPTINTIVGGGQLLTLLRGVSSIDQKTGREDAGSLVAYGGDKVIEVHKVLAADDQAVYLKVLVRPQFETAGDQMVLALDTANRINKKWAQPDQDTEDSLATGRVTGGTLLHSRGKSLIVARDVKDGRELWRVDTGTVEPWRIWCDDKRLYCLTEDSDLQAVGLADGKQLWRLKPDHGRFAPVTAGNGMVYGSDGSEAVFAYDAETGKTRWRCALPQRPSLTSEPLLVGDTLFVPSEFDGGLYAVDAKSGTFKWTFDDPSYPIKNNDWYLSTDGKVAFARRGAKIYALPAG